MPKSRRDQASPSLASRAAAFFPKTIKARGISYFEDRAVRLVKHTNTAWRFEVSGTRKYQVAIATASLTTSPGICTCPAFDESGSCKHLWASILELDLLLGAAAVLGKDAPMFRRDAAGQVVGWRDAKSRALCASSFDVDRWGQGVAVALGLVAPFQSAATDSEDGAEPVELAPRNTRLRQIDDLIEFGDAPEPDDDDDDDDFDEFDDDMFLDDELDDLEQTIDIDQPRPTLRALPGLPKPAAKLDWQSRLLILQRAEQLQRVQQPQAIEATFLIDGDTARRNGDLVVWIATRKPRLDGRMGLWQLSRRGELDQAARSLPAGHAVPLLLALTRPTFQANYRSEPFDVKEGMVDVVLTALAGSSVRLWRDVAVRPRLPKELPPEIAFDAGPPFSVVVVHRHADAGGRSIVEVVAERGEERIIAGDVVAVLPGWLVTAQRLVRCNLQGAHALCRPLLLDGPLDAPQGSEQEVLATIAPMLGQAMLRSATLAIETDVAPAPVLSLDQPAPNARSLTAHVHFDYGSSRIAADDPRALWTEGPRLLRRDQVREQAALAALRQLSCRPEPDGSWAAPIPTFPATAHALLASGWRLEAQGRPVRRAGFSHLAVRSSAAWFDVEAAVEFDGRVVPLPALLRSLAHSKSLVELGDGSFGLLPERWLERWQTLLAFGDKQGDALRLRPPQGWIIDMLLADRVADTVKLDAAYEKRQARWRSFDGIAPAQEPTTFTGELRPYQRQGLGWLRFLQEFALGGCLADDMGLGKTAQVLALLAGRKRGRRGKPTLVVAPRSVVFHWREETARFAPALQAHEHLGLQRWAQLGDVPDPFQRFDLVLTTYGTLVRDLERLASIEFHTVVLDEANAIKNANSQRAKAARALRADHRLALSGTPIENSLDELWSLFEFLNPGMLGRAAAFRELLATQRANRTGPAPTPSFGERLRDVLRPFFLRRTKAAVLSDLPQKTEQVVCCDLEGDQRRDYDQLRDHYRTSLRSRIAAAGLAKSKMHVLEALLRLRQIACHRGLIDRKLRNETSAKLESLLPMLDEVVRGGHKALVFSQFTSFLAIVRDRLNDQSIAHEYLDGQTTKRQAAVEHFQNDPDCKVFLLSLRAGGVGLNLTAADYVFLLDPWWNPAIEAQAIDRTHRIGQTRKVLAYRLIARHTIEEKLLDLQRDKRALAQALFADDGSPLRGLTAEDLERLLS